MGERRLGKIRNIGTILINRFISFFIYKDYKTLYGGILMENELRQEMIELIKEYNFKDSIDIGNSKTGSIKVYVDFDKEAETDAKVKKAIKVLKENRKEILE